MNRENEMRRNDEFLSVWSMDGSIYVKTSPLGRPVRINELEDLDCLGKEDKTETYFWDKNTKRKARRRRERS